MKIYPCKQAYSSSRGHEQANEDQTIRSTSRGQGRKRLFIDDGPLRRPICRSFPRVVRSVISWFVFPYDLWTSPPMVIPANRANVNRRLSALRARRKISVSVCRLALSTPLRLRSRLLAQSSRRRLRPTFGQQQWSLPGRPIHPCRPA